MKCLIYVIFIIVLQQIDGNIIGPKILGNSTGINGFWIMFAILLGGGLFGFIGMLLGVPVFVVIYAGLEKLVNDGLKKTRPPDGDRRIYGSGLHRRCHDAAGAPPEGSAARIA